MTPRLVKVCVSLFVVSVPFVAQAAELGVALTPSHVLGLATIALAAATWFRDRPELPHDVALFALGAFVLLSAFTVVRVQLEPDREVIGETLHAKSVKQFVGLAFGSAVFSALVCLMRWYGLTRRVLDTHYWTTVAFAVLTLVQYAIAVGDLTSPLANFPVHNSTLGGQRRLSLMYGFPRVSLTLVEPSTLATYLLSGLALWLYSFERPFVHGERARRAFLLSGIVLATAIIVTGSRMAYVTTAALIAVAFVVRPWRLRRLAVAAIGIVAGVVLTGPAHGRALVATLLPKSMQTAAVATWRPGSGASGGGPSSGGRTVNGRTATATDEHGNAIDDMTAAVATQDISVQQRMASYLVAAAVLEKRPFLGTGFGTSGFYMEQHWPNAFAPLPDERVSAATMTSHYAAVLTETGLLGGACLLLFGVGLAWRLWQFGRHHPTEAPLAWSLGASIAAYAVSALATALVVYQILLVWLVPAIVVALRSPDDLRATPVGKD